MPLPPPVSTAIRSLKSRISPPPLDRSNADTNPATRTNVIRCSRFVFGDKSVDRGEDECGGVVRRKLRRAVPGRCNVGGSFLGERGEGGQTEGRERGDGVGFGECGQ